MAVDTTTMFFDADGMDSARSVDAKPGNETHMIDARDRTECLANERRVASAMADGKSTSSPRPERRDKQKLGGGNNRDVDDLLVAGVRRRSTHSQKAPLSYITRIRGFKRMKRRTGTIGWDFASQCNDPIEGRSSFPSLRFG